jgi:hypothetical protein
MKPAKFETYKPKADEFKVAQSRTGSPQRPYVPTQHPFAERLAEHRSIPSIWTPGVVGSGK